MKGNATVALGPHRMTEYYLHILPSLGIQIGTTHHPFGVRRPEPWAEDENATAFFDPASKHKS